MVKETAGGSHRLKWWCALTAGARSASRVLGGARRGGGAAAASRYRFICDLYRLAEAGGHAGSRDG